MRNAHRDSATKQDTSEMLVLLTQAMSMLDMTSETWTELLTTAQQDLQNYVMSSVQSNTLETGVDSAPFKTKVLEYTIRIEILEEFLAGMPEYHQPNENNS